MEFEVTPRQKAFLEAGADEVLFGGAAGGGKSYGQLLDALLYALRYPGSNQLILRRSFPDLERSLVRVHLQFYPKKTYRYTASLHRGVFCEWFGDRIRVLRCRKRCVSLSGRGVRYDPL